MVCLVSGDYAYQDADDVTYCDGDDEYALADDTFTCEQDSMTYSTENNTSVFIDELEMDVHELNVEAAYTDNGYEYNDETMEWELITEKTEA